MTVLPGSLDYLYYNGVLDHIPYEAYQTAPMNGTQYLNQAKQGQLYNTYVTPDTFVKQGMKEAHQGEGHSFLEKAYGYNDGVGKDVDVETKVFGEERKEMRESAQSGLGKAYELYEKTPVFVKGLLAGGLMVGTLVCLLKGKKKPPVTASSSKTSFWTKLNPKNWFKKKV